MTRWFGFGLIVAVGFTLVAGQMFNADTQLFDPLIPGVAFGIYASLGALIIAKRDGHLTGWLLTLSGLAIVIADGFGRLPFVGAELALWVGSWAWTAVFAVFAAMTLTFPAGHTPQGPGVLARLGRIAVYALPLLVAMAALTKNLGGPEGGALQINPFGFLPTFLALPSTLGVVAIWIAATTSLIVKRRGASGTERAQVTWVVFALTIFVALVIATFIYLLAALEVTGEDPGDVAWTPVFLMMFLFPLSFAVAILRYRLFDIGRIVSRTITYAIVAALLAGAFFAVVTVLGTVIPVDDTSWQVAASTLVVAFLFNPARSRMQDLVDRRFNRRQYDTQRVSEGLTEQIRNVTDPLAIGEALAQVVASTMQPAAIHLWLRDRKGKS